ncbi:hypothetical protein GGGNBK_05045 [Sporosarcina sp. ANT_H38]
MNKDPMSFSIIFLGICILLATWFISKSFKFEPTYEIQEEALSSELISPNE